MVLTTDIIVVRFWAEAYDYCVKKAYAYVITLIWLYEGDVPLFFFHGWYLKWIEGNKRCSNVRNKYIIDLRF